jgi:ubiquinone/menaquinone biosynthesis C-methylase UbiE
MTRSDDVAKGYDALADAYARELFDELAGKPLDRALLTAFVEQVKDVASRDAQDAAILEVGCGPGQIARFVHELDAAGRVRVVGTDVSPEMLAVAKRRSPTIEFHHGDMLSLDETDATYAGVLAFYAIVHLAPEQLVVAFREMHRVLRPRGLALIAFHLTSHADGSIERVRPGELWGKQIELEWLFFPRALVQDALREAGLVIEARLEREPHEGAEHPSRRAYLLTRKPA